MYIEKSLRSLNSAHEKWVQKKKCGIYNFGQCRNVIPDVITCRYFFKYKYNVKTCTSTISALYQMINLNV